MTKRCFVISPIGASDSAVREHADDVFEFIIKPAMDELGIYVYRSDHSHELGRITEQMFSSILNDDLCISVLTFFNPNVFYELAVAQCAARPVIILIEKGQSIPFDVRDLRAVEYDLRPRPLRDKVYVKQIVNLVQGLKNANWVVPVPFGEALAPLGAKRDDLNVYDKLEQFGPSDRLLTLLSSAKESIDLSGLTLKWWIKLMEFESILKEKAEEGVKVRCMLVPALADLFPDLRIDGRERMMSHMDKSYSWFTELAATVPNLEVRKVRVGCLNHQVIRTDQKLLLTIPLQSRGPTSQYPLLECSPSSPLFKAMTEEFDAIWKANAKSPVEREINNETE